jgi:hypothetical protein
LKIAEIAVYDARSINPRQAQKKALTHTEMIGVCVLELILYMYFENGSISSIN